MIAARVATAVAMRYADHFLAIGLTVARNLLLEDVRTVAAVPVLIRLLSLTYTILPNSDILQSKCERSGWTSDGALL